jgi:hypothetical protein
MFSGHSQRCLTLNYSNSVAWPAKIPRPGYARIVAAVEWESVLDAAVAQMTMDMDRRAGCVQ